MTPVTAELFWRFGGQRVAAIGAEPRVDVDRYVLFDVGTELGGDALRWHEVEYPVDEFPASGFVGNELADLRGVGAAEADHVRAGALRRRRRVPNQARGKVGDDRP